MKTTCYQSNCNKKAIKLEMALYNSDEREIVTNPESWPHSAHGRVLVVDKKSQETLWVGSGTLIGPIFVLTAAHNLYHPHYNILLDDTQEIRFIPAASVSETLKDFIRVVDYRLPKKYKNLEKDPSKNSEDYALLVLEKDIHKEAWYFGLHACSKCLHEMMTKELYVGISGYPLKTKDGKRKNFAQLGMKGKIDKLDDDYIYYKKIATDGGQSGSCIYYEDEGNCWIIGVHRGSIEKESNFGIRLSIERFREIESWMKSYLRINKDDTRNLTSSQLKALFQRNDVKVLEFKLNSHSLDEELLEQMTKWSALKVLTHLRMNRCRIADRVASVLFKNTNWAYLHTFDLRHNNIDAKGAAALGQNTVWTNLHTLHLSGNSIGDEGAAALSQNKVWTNLHTLHLSNNDIREKGLKLEQQRKNEFKRVFLQNLSDYSHRRRMEKLNLKKITQRYQFILKRDALMTMQYIYQRQSRFRTLITSVYRMFLKKAFDNLNFRTFISCSIDLVISSIRHLAY